MTLIEVMVALLVTTMALLGALATVGMTVRGASFSRSATEASVLAQSKLEQLVSLLGGQRDHEHPCPTAPLTERRLDANGTTPSSSPGNIRTRAPWTWSQHHAPDTLRRIITVKVDWTDGLGEPHRVAARRRRYPRLRKAPARFHADGDL